MTTICKSDDLVRGMERARREFVTAALHLRAEATKCERAIHHIDRCLAEVKK